MTEGALFKPRSRYRDTGRPDDPEDQFMRWINLRNSGMANSPGIRALRYLGRPLFTRLPAFAVLVTKRSSQGGSYNPWNDDVDLDKGVIGYWGDAKLHPSKRFTDFNGNRTLEKIWRSLNEGKHDEVPPILHFLKEERGRVTFSGICVMTSLWVKRFQEKGQSVENYRCRLRVLDPDEPVSVSWLRSRREAGSVEAALLGAPECWSAWVRGQASSSEMQLDAQSVETSWAAEGAGRARGQGFSADPRANKAVELEAMRRARLYFETQGFTHIEDVSRNQSFDLHVRNERQEFFVEVKGTRSLGAQLMLTSNEVQFARRHKDKMALYVLHSVRIREENGGVGVDGGVERVLLPWDVDSGSLKPISFFYTPEATQHDARPPRVAPAGSRD